MDVGICGYDRIFPLLAAALPDVNKALLELGTDGLMADIEGHMVGGGQFGGESERVGIGVAARAVMYKAWQHGIDLSLRTDADCVKIADR
jgi:hypothetical protein